MRTGFALFLLLASGVALSQPARPVAYHWSENRSFDQPSEARQQGETALATDAKGRVWLSYLDADYRQMPTGMWVAWPRRVVVRASDDGGRTFGAARVMSETGTDQALASDAVGGVFVAWKQTDYPKSSPTGKPLIGSEERVVVRHLSYGEEPGARREPLPWNSSMRHDQSSVLVDSSGTLHVLGVDLNARHGSQIPPQAMRAMQQSVQTSDAKPTLYANSRDGGATFTSRLRVDEVGPLPQLAVSGNLVLIAGANGYVRSQDGGKTFSPAVARRFGQKLARVAQSPDGRTLYVLGDSPRNGLTLSRSTDQGSTWETARVDDAPRASAWRYPAMHIERSGRVHAVWMDDRSGAGAVYHVFSDDGGRTFSPSTRVSDKDYPFPADAPPPPPANRKGTWIGDYMSITTTGRLVVVAWSDQRAGTPKSIVQYSTGVQGQD